MSVELMHRCGVCRCYIDQEDLFCANCGTENPYADTKAKKLAHEATHHSFDCQGCGASMNYDASAQALRCPFCGGTKMEKRAVTQHVKPDAVLPFSIDAVKAEGILREFLSKGFWRPDDAAQSSTIGEVTEIFVPYWVFDATTKTKWTADSSPAPPGSRGDWYPVSGDHARSYKGLLIAGSSVLTLDETESISPFNIANVLAPTEVDLENVTYEEFRVPRKLARPQARGAIEQLERQHCARLVPNRHRNVHVNVRISDMQGYPMLLPVWIMAYQYKNKVFRVLINGQSGKIAGAAPFSYAKVGVIALVVATVLITIGVIVALVNMN
ncbi:MAG: hypothetical protein AAF483_05465 [Planctomycetota bacterium]